MCSLSISDEVKAFKEGTDIEGLLLLLKSEFQADCPHTFNYKVSLYDYKWGAASPAGNCYGKFEKHCNHMMRLRCDFHNFDWCSREMRAPLEVQTVGGEKRSCCLPWDARESLELHDVCFFFWGGGGGGLKRLLLYKQRSSWRLRQCTQWMFTMGRETLLGGIFSSPRLNLLLPLTADFQDEAPTHDTQAGTRVPSWAIRWASY